MHAAPNESLILFKDHTAEELRAALELRGVTARLARRLQAAVLQRRAANLPTSMPEVSPRLLERVRETTAIPHLDLIEKLISPVDGFAKYLFCGTGPELFEAV